MTPPAKPITIQKHSLKGLADDVSATLSQTDLPDALKAAMGAEIKASGAKAVVLDIHRHEIDGATGKTVNGHFTIKPLF